MESTVHHLGQPDEKARRKKLLTPTPPTHTYCPVLCFFSVTQAYRHSRPVSITLDYSPPFFPPFLGSHDTRRSIRGCFVTYRCLGGPSSFQSSGAYIPKYETFMESDKMHGISNGEKQFDAYICTGSNMRTLLRTSANIRHYLVDTRLESGKHKRKVLEQNSLGA